jgi:hypothetical protein
MIFMVGLPVDKTLLFTPMSSKWLQPPGENDESKGFILNGYF